MAIYVYGWIVYSCMRLDLHNKLLIDVYTDQSTYVFCSILQNTRICAPLASLHPSLLKPFDMHLQDTHHILSCTRLYIVYATKSVCLWS